MELKEAKIVKLTLLKISLHSHDVFVQIFHKIGH